MTTLERIIYWLCVLLITGWMISVDEPIIAFWAAAVGFVWFWELKA